MPRPRAGPCCVAASQLSPRETWQVCITVQPLSDNIDSCQAKVACLWTASERAANGGLADAGLSHNCLAGD